MSSKRVYLLPIIVLLIGFAIVLFLANGKPPPKTQEPDTQSALPVDTLVVSPGPLSATVYTQGTVQARQAIDLVAEVAGKVISVDPQFVAGGYFAKDQVLLRIEPSDYEFAVAQAKARVAEAEEQLATTRGQALQAKREWRELGSKTANDLFLRKPQLARAEAQLAAAQSQLRKARKDVQRTQLSVPFEGRVRELFANLGQYVAPAQRIANVYSTDTAEIRLPLSDRQLGLLNLSLRGIDLETKTIPVVLKAQRAGKQWQWNARLIRTEAAVDERSRVVYAVAEVLKPYDYGIDAARPPLTVGQFVQAEIAGRVLQSVVQIPRDALRANDTVWLLTPDSTLNIHAVKVEQYTSTHALVSGLPAGTQEIIVSSIPLPVNAMVLKAPERQPTLVLDSATAP
ncbi:MAG: efflux RND transporter periplasmic adaptor subunit [Pseudomonadales bacterium]